MDRRAAAFGKIMRRALTTAVCFGSKADMDQQACDVRFVPKSRHSAVRSAWLLCPRKGHLGARFECPLRANSELCRCFLEWTFVPPLE